MQSVYLQRIMKKNAAKGYEKTNPIQTQFQKAGGLSVKKLTDFLFDLVVQNRYFYAQLF